MSEEKETRELAQELGKISAQELLLPPGVVSVLSDIILNREEDLISLIETIQDDKEKLKRKDELLKELIDDLEEFRKKKRKDGWKLPDDLFDLLLLLIVIFRRIESILKEIKEKLFKLQEERPKR